MDETTVTLTLSKADAQRLLGCLTRLETLEQARYEQALTQLEENPRDEGHAERRGRLREEIGALAKLSSDAERLKEIVYDVMNPGARRSSPSGR